MSLLRKFALLLGSLWSVSVVAEPEANWDFDTVVTRIFWEELHKDGGWTLDCGYRFDAVRRSESGGVAGVEHIYPIDGMLKALRCDSRLQCRDRRGRRYQRMEADLHNLYAAWMPLLLYRNGARYGLIDGEDWRLDDCDIEWARGILEPRPLARGNIARAMLYMHDTYRLPLDMAARRLFRQWNEEDPPSEQERMRNDLIERLQGRRNPYIDQSAAAPGTAMPRTGGGVADAPPAAE
jgi:deoxyribonuclease-1